MKSPQSAALSSNGRRSELDTVVSVDEVEDVTMKITAMN